MFLFYKYYFLFLVESFYRNVIVDIQSQHRYYNLTLNEVIMYDL